MKSVFTEIEHMRYEMVKTTSISHVFLCFVVYFLFLLTVILSSLLVLLSYLVFISILVHFFIKFI